MAHPELAPKLDAGALHADSNTSCLAHQTPVLMPFAVWGRAAALLPNNPVSSNFRYCGCRRVSTGAVIRLAPVNTMFIQS